MNITRTFEKWRLTYLSLIVAWLCVCLSIGVVQAQQAYTGLTFPPLTFTPPQIERQTLANGMRVFLVEDHELPVITVYALVKTGGIYEPPEKIGLAEIAAEVLRTGGTTQHSPDAINKILENLAASVEVNIEKEQGSVELWTLKQHFETSFAIFADILRHPAFDPAKVDLAKTQMAEMIRRRNDTPDEISSREFLRVVYGNQHPLARIPQLDTISKISRTDLVAFHQAYFQPNNLMLAVTGDFTPADMLPKLNAAFQDWPPAEVAFPPVATITPVFQPAVYLIDKDVAQTNLVIGHLGIKADNPDYPAVRVLDLILGSGGFSSRLFQKVRNEKGLTYSVGSYLGAGVRDDDAFIIQCGTRNDAVQEALTAILDEIEKLTVAEVSDGELQAAKDQYLNSFVFKFATVNGIVRRKMFYEYHGFSPDFLETFRERVLNVTTADVLRVAQRYLHPESMIILAVGNAKEIQAPLATFGPVREIILDKVE